MFITVQQDTKKKKKCTTELSGIILRKSDLLIVIQYKKAKVGTFGHLSCVKLGLGTFTKTSGLSC